MIKKILVAIDGSQSADHALDFGLDLAEKYSAEVLMATVFDSPQPSLVVKGMLYTPTSTENHLKKLKNFHEKILLDALNKAKKNSPKLKVSTKLFEGRPADKIVETAKEEDFDRPLLHKLMKEKRIWSYGFKKRKCEEVLNEAHEENGFPVSIFRFPIIMGERDYTLRAYSYFLRIQDP